MVRDPAALGLNRIHFENVEGNADWNIKREFWSGRPPGLSAMVRLKNEAEWIKPSLDSIVSWCDEVAIFLQGKQTDGTDDIVRAWASDHPGKTIILEYPFDSLPNGPGHDRQQRGSLYERAYFYNWCLARTRFDHAMKWDGDMVAHDNLGGMVRNLMPWHDVIKFRGTDICGADLRRMCIKPRTANEPRVYKVTDKTWHYSGARCEHFTYGHDDGHPIDGEAYLHFKWAKSFESASKDWPENWRNVPHFVDLMNRKTCGRRYRGPWPSALGERAPC